MIVLRPWVCKLTLMQQTVLLSTIRGPDNTSKYHPSKKLMKFYRRSVLLSAFDKAILDNPTTQGGGSFTGPIDLNFRDEWEWVAEEKVTIPYLQSIDELPHHFVIHMNLSSEILGYKHPHPRIRKYWFDLYKRVTQEFHLSIETEEQLDLRLSDNKENWLKSCDPATVR